MLCVPRDSVDVSVSYSIDPSFESDYRIHSDESIEACLEVPSSDPARWGIILAGGDGTRLQGLTRMISGDDRPKQFCPIVGTQTLLQQAVARAARSVAPEQTLIALTRAHSKYYERDLAGSCLRRLVQPSNRGTAPPIIISLLHIARINPGALVAILPSDHYYSDESAFARALESAFQIADSRRSFAVLLGAQPRSPEIEFGWIELAAPVENDLFRVSSFQEKPNLDLARRLLASGALWNTFVVVGSVDALIDMAFAAVPDLVISFFSRLNGDTLQIPVSLYDATPSTDFSRRVLSPNAKSLLALRLHSMEWHDLGQPDRVVSVVRSRDEVVPTWMYAWEAASRSSHVIPAT